VYVFVCTKQNTSRVFPDTVTYTYVHTYINTYLCVCKSIHTMRICSWTLPRIHTCMHTYKYIYCVSKYTYHEGCFWSLSHVHIYIQLHLCVTQNKDTISGSFPTLSHIHTYSHAYTYICVRLKMYHDAFPDTVTHTYMHTNRFTCDYKYTYLHTNRFT